MNDYRWSLGTLIWLPVCVLLIAGLLYCIRLLRRVEASQRGDRYGMAGEAKAAWIACIVLAALLLLFTATGMWPYKTEYHQWQTTGGTVQSIDSRLLGGDRSTTERFVVTFDDGRQRSCDDTRCAQVHEGDDLTLACKRAYQWSGTHGYDCNYVSHRPVR